MKSSIWEGIFYTDIYASFQRASYYCSTGNCEWNDYSSLGVCSKCADVSSKLIKSCTPKAMDLNNATGCDISLPNGFALGGLEGARNHIMAVSTTHKPIVYNNYTNPLVTIQVIASYDTFFVNATTPINATECVLTPCMINYMESFSEHSGEDAELGFNGPNFLERVDSTYDNYTYGVGTYPWNGTTIENNADTSRPSAYQVSYPAFTAMVNYLESIFNGYVLTYDGRSWVYSGDNITRAVFSNPADAMHALHSPVGICYDPFLNAIYDPAACSIQMAALGMTMSIRNNLFSPIDFNTNFAIGQTYTDTQIILVAWHWIIPVAAIWLLCVILSAVTIWKAQRKAVGMGMNPLTYLFLNLEDDPTMPQARQWWRSDDETKKLADKLQVQLQLKDQRMTLVPVDAAAEPARKAK
jgi:hypothetical protein